jgi:hypothetical protein
MIALNGLTSSRYVQTSFDPKRFAMVLDVEMRVIENRSVRN